MGWFAEVTAIVAPFFIVMSPILSYGDQTVSMYRKKSSAGFSLDIPLIMLVASFLRIFYWPASHYEKSLLCQSLLMVVVHVTLLKVALDYRPAASNKGGDAGLPFADDATGVRRPYNFWQWRAPRKYWQTILYFLAVLITLHLLLSRMPDVFITYSNAIGYIGLAVEATLPIPQILTNMRSKSVKGLRLSVLAAWLGGDAMKLYWFFTAPEGIPWAFKISGMFQGSCDALLGLQYLIYGEGEQAAPIKEHPLTATNWSDPVPANRIPSRSLTAVKRPDTFNEAVVKA